MENKKKINNKNIYIIFIYKLFNLKFIKFLNQKNTILIF